MITTKIPPLFDGSTSWFKYEELIDEWLDLTVLQAEIRGPALKNRLVGDAEMYKGLLDREWVLVQCLLCCVTYGLHRKNSINSHMGEGNMCFLCGHD